MTNWKTRSLTSIEVDGIEVELETTPEAGTSVKFVQQGNKLVVAYLTHDDDCGNPLASQDGNGMIHWHPRAKYGRTCGDNYHGLLNIDQYGTKQIDEDKLQQAWRDKVMALPLELFELHVDDNLSAEKLQELLADEDIIGDYSVHQQVLNAWDLADKHGLGEHILAIEEALAWDYDTEADKCWKGPEKGVVLLDCYEHGGISLSVSGSGTQCRWDTSSGAAVWAPDSCAMDEIDRRAAVYAFGIIGYMDEFPANVRKWSFQTDDKYGSQFFESWGDAFNHASEYVLSKYDSPTPEQLALGIERAAEEICKAALDQYNAWANGDCWNVWSQRFELIDEQWVEVGESDCCGGCIGDEWAEQELQDCLNFDNWPEKGKAA